MGTDHGCSFIALSAGGPTASTVDAAVGWSSLRP